MPGPHGQQIIGPTSHYFYSQRLKLHYVDWGNPDKPLMALIHGGRDHCRNGDWVAQAFRDDFTEAQELMEDLVTDQLALTSPLRSKVHSSLGQYYAMQHATDLAEEQSPILRAGQYPPSSTCPHSRSRSGLLNQFLKGNQGPRQEPP